jgi:hypothetical protein
MGHGRYVGVSGPGFRLDSAAISIVGGFASILEYWTGVQVARCCRVERVEEGSMAREW